MVMIKQTGGGLIMIVRLWYMKRSELVVDSIYLCIVVIQEL